MTNDRPQTPNPKSQTPPQLRLDRASFVAPVGSRYLLKDLSAAIFPGDRIVLAGASGAGKTLFLQLLNRRVEPSSGTVYLGDRDLRQIQPLKVRRSVTLVPSEPKLLGMTVGETLAYPLELRGAKSSEIQSRVGEWRDRLQIPANWMSRKSAQLSLGQRQQVAIARALVIQPAILLLDDPLVLLDGAMGDRLLTLLTELSQTQKMTVIASTRQPDQMASFAQRLFYLQEGELQDLPDPIDWTALTAQIAETERQADREWGE